mmetsp:Transcript_99268/g.289687  ORF Transcript_99268/g.289687 Transcript_99268/m.289687 type:complete len:129 (+) Transcript_99268:91-477(+)
MSSHGSLEEQPTNLEPAAATGRGVRLRSAWVGHALDETAPLLLHCFLAMLVTATAMELLASLGLREPTGSCCGGSGAGGGSSGWCQVWQDVSTLAYVCLGTILCVRSGVGANGGEDREKGGFYAFLLW